MTQMNDLQRLKYYDLDLYRQSLLPAPPNLLVLVTAHGQSASKVPSITHTETKHRSGQFPNKNTHEFFVVGCGGVGFFVCGGVYLK